jgi:hypothetical protein
MYLLDISDWWQTKALFEKIFWIIAVLFSLLFLIQTILSFIGGDGTEGHADDAVADDDGIGYQFFTIKNMIAFFTMFGWTGIGGINGGLSKPLIIVIAFLCGAALVAGMMFLMRSAAKLKHSGTLRMENALQQVGEVYLRIPAARSGLGKVHIKVQGSLHELDAMTDEADDIATGRIVKVRSIIGDHILLVTSSIH